MNRILALFWLVTAAGWGQPAAIRPPLDEDRAKVAESSRQAELRYWTRRAGIAAEAPHARAVLRALNGGAAEWARASRSLAEMRAGLLYWSSRIPAAAWEIDRTMPLLRLPADGSCQQLQAELRQDHQSLAFYENKVRHDPPGEEKRRDEDAIERLETDIASLEEEIHFACNPSLPPPSAGNDVLTQHNDNQRTGAHLREKVLSPGSVGSGRFGRLFDRDVDGDVYAQPLYVEKLEIPGQGTKNVVYVATENDTVYAFDADEANRVKPYWTAHLGAAAPIWNQRFLLHRSAALTAA